MPLIIYSSSEGLCHGNPHNGGCGFFGYWVGHPSSAEGGGSALSLPVWLQLRELAFAWQFPDPWCWAGGLGVHWIGHLAGIPQFIERFIPNWFFCHEGKEGCVWGCRQDFDDHQLVKWSREPWPW